MLSGTALDLYSYHIQDYIPINESGLLFPYTENLANKAAIQMFTEEEIKNNNYTVRLSKERYKHASDKTLIFLSLLVLP